MTNALVFVLMFWQLFSKIVFAGKKSLVLSNWHDSNLKVKWKQIISKVENLINCQQLHFGYISQIQENSIWITYVLNTKHIWCLTGFQVVLIVLVLPLSTHTHTHTRKRIKNPHSYVFSLYLFCLLSMVFNVINIKIFP